MAKQKKKKSKHKKGYPPLSKADKFIATIVPIIALVLLYTIILGYEWFAPYFVFRQNSETLAFCETSSFLRIAPFWVVSLILFGIILNRSTSKKPIFGNKKIDYYNTTFYKFILPPFDKRYFKRFWTKDKVRKVLIKTITIITVTIITFLYGFGGLVSRWEISESSILKYGTDNSIEERFLYDDILSYEVKANLKSTYGKFTSFYTTLGMKITLKDGEELYFDLKFINGGISGLYKLDKSLNGINKTVNDNLLKRYIDNHSLSDEELRMIYEIYSQ